MPLSGNRSNKFESSFNAMNLNSAGENGIEQTYYEHQLQPAGSNYNNRYKSKSKKNGRLNYTGNQYRSAQNRMSRGHYQDEMLESAKDAHFESHVNEIDDGERDQQNETNNQFELQDYKRTLNMASKRGYGGDQLTSDGTPLISGDCKF